MSISIQDFEADIPELAGTICERLLSVQSRQEDGSIVPCVFWLKIQGGRWHRFFVDAWVLHWDEQDTLDEDDLVEQPDFPVLDVGAHYRLVGSVISKVEMRETPEDPEFDARLTILFGDGRALVLQHSEDDSRMSVIQHDAA